MKEMFLKLFPVRGYIVHYPITVGSMIINEEHYICLACCKYHAYLQFIKATKNKFNHYSARENRTPLTFDIWKEDIYTYSPK